MDEETFVRLTPQKSEVAPSIQSGVIMSRTLSHDNFSCSLVILYIRFLMYSFYNIKSASGVHREGGAEEYNSRSV